MVLVIRENFHRGITEIKVQKSRFLYRHHRYQWAKAHASAYIWCVTTDVGQNTNAKLLSTQLVIKNNFVLMVFTSNWVLILICYHLNFIENIQCFHGRMRYGHRKQNISRARSSSVYYSRVIGRLKIVLRTWFISVWRLFVSLCSLIFECYWILSILEYFDFLTNDKERPASRVSRIRSY